MIVGQQLQKKKNKESQENDKRRKKKLKNQSKGDIVKHREIKQDERRGK
jgi:hypothetical protein